MVEGSLKNRIGQRAKGRGELEIHSSQLAVLSQQPNAIKSMTADCRLQTVDCSPWFVLKTKTKCEKYIRDRLQFIGLEAFVPLIHRTARYQRKVKKYELPLITCYAFVRLPRHRRNEVLALPYVHGFLRLNGKDCTVSETEMQWLQQISGTDLDVRTETQSMQQGDKVMLAYGQLAGMEGYVVSNRSKHEVIVALESLGLQMVIQVETNLLVRV